MAARLRIADSIAGALDRSLLGECSIGSGTRERGSCYERNERSNLGPRSKGLEAPRPCAWQSPNQIRRNPGGGGRWSRRRRLRRGLAACDPEQPVQDRSGRANVLRIAPVTCRTLRPERRHATGSDQRTRDETPQSAESSGPGRLERSRRTLTSALSSWISAVSSACSA